MDFLLEIGSEEMPFSLIKTTHEEMKKLFEKILAENRISYDNLKTFYTPRRYVFHLTNVCEKQTDINQKILGPSKKIAYNKDGSLSKIGLGFITSKKIDMKNIKIFSEKKGDYIGFHNIEKGKLSKEILPQIISKLIINSKFKKSMFWNNKNIAFLRPIRWINAMLGSEKLDIVILNKKFNTNVTYGLNRVNAIPIEYDSIDSYYKNLKNSNVILDFTDRKNLIKEKISKICNKDLPENSTVLIDEKLLSEIASIVEFPYPIVGKFNKDFLEIPQELLIITMKYHQKYFPIVDSNGKLVNYFVVIRNGIKNSEYVRKGNEKVLSARFSDAKFFFAEDMKQDVEKLNLKLENVIFQSKLGTIYQKVERMQYIGKHLAIKEKLNANNIYSAINLSKFDLVTNVLSEKEYTSLQGLMGSIYAKKIETNDNILTAIKEQYLPKSLTDNIPSTIEGQILSIVDKIDTIVGCFAIGLIPTGSQDPYALRRAAQAIAKILIETKSNINLKELIEVSLKSYCKISNVFYKSETEILTEIFNYFSERIITVFLKTFENKKIISLVVKEYGYNLNYNIFEIIKKIELFELIINHQYYKNIVDNALRIQNIIKNSTLFIEVDESIFETNHEIELNKILKIIETKISKLNLLNEKLNELNKITDPLEQFFENVLVNCENNNIKNNRISLLNSILKIYNNIAPILKLT